MKIYSVDAHDGSNATFHPTLGLAKKKSTELRKQKVIHTVRCHEINGRVNAVRVCALLHADTKGWADKVTVVSVYDGTRKKVGPTLQASTFQKIDGDAGFDGTDGEE